MQLLILLTGLIALLFSVFVLATIIFATAEKLHGGSFIATIRYCWKFY